MWRSKGGIGGKKTIEGLTQATTNTDELKEAINADLRNKKEETYRCRVAVEDRRIFLVKQVDAVAWVGEDEEICDDGGGGTLAAERQQEEEDKRLREKMKKT